MEREQDNLLSSLAAVLPADALEFGSDKRRALARYALSKRGSPADPAMPLAVVRPGNAEEAAAAISAAAQVGLGLVPYGAGTGLMGGAHNLRPSVVLDTSRLDSIDVLPSDRLVWAGSGARLEDVDRELHSHGMRLGHDPWTFPIASVGGVISTNGLGYSGARFGGIAAQILGLEVVMPDGNLLRSRAVSRRSAGPEISRLLIGAEGTLGLITSAALKAFPMPEERCLLAFRFPSFEKGLAAVQMVTDLGMRPTLLDYGEEHESPWPELIKREEESPTLYLGFEGFEEEVEASSTRVAKLVLEFDSERLPDEVAERFWRDRHVDREWFQRGTRPQAETGGE